MRNNTIIDTKLEGYIKSDLKLIGLPVDFELVFKGYSSTYYGRYYIQEKRIVVYILDERGERLPYHEILDTVLHESIHHYQHQYEEGFVRLRGVMHNLEFKRLYDKNMYKLKQLEVIPSDYS